MKICVGGNKNSTMTKAMVLSGIMDRNYEKKTGRKDGRIELGGCPITLSA